MAIAIRHPLPNEQVSLPVEPGRYIARNPASGRAANQLELELELGQGSMVERQGHLKLHLLGAEVIPRHRLPHWLRLLVRGI